MKKRIGHEFMVVGAGKELAETAFRRLNNYSGLQTRTQLAGAAMTNQPIQGALPVPSADIAGLIPIDSPGSATSFGTTRDEERDE